MKRLLVSLGLILTLAFPLPVSADTQGSCTPSFNVSVRLKENIPSDHSDGDDSVWVVCNGGANSQNGNLNNIPHTLPGNCNDGGFGEFDWNDCVSAVVVYLPTQFWRFCGYADINMHGRILFNLTGPLWPGDSWLTGAYADALTSFRIRYAEGC